MRKPKFILASTIAVFFGTQTIPRAAAQTPNEWTGTAGSGWSAAENWLNGALAGGEQLFFGETFLTEAGSAFISNNDLAAYQGFQITFEDTTAISDPAFTITGNAFTLAGVGGFAPLIENQSTSLQTFNLGGTLTLDGSAGGGFAEIKATSGDLLFQNAIALAGSSATQLRIGGSNGNDVTFNGPISGSNGLVVDGNANVVLAGNNSFNGGIAINAGRVNVTANENLGAASGSVTIDGGELAVGGTFSSARNISLGLGGGTIDISAGNTWTVSNGLVATAGSLTKAGSGTLILSAASTRTGVTNINEGAIRVNSATALGSGSATIGSAGTLEIGVVGGVTPNMSLANGATIKAVGAGVGSTAGVVDVGANAVTFSTALSSSILNIGTTGNKLTGTADAVITVEGLGRVAMNQANAYAGKWVVNSGILSIGGNGSAFGVNTDADAMKVNAGGTLTSKASVAPTAIPITLNGGTIASGDANMSWNGPIAITATSVATGADTFASGTERFTTLAGQITSAAGVPLVISGTATVSGGNRVSGRVILSNAANSGTFAGGIRLDSGSLAFTANGAWGTGPITGNGFGRIFYQSGVTASYNVANAVDIVPGGILEYQADSTTNDATLTLNQDGLITMGAGSSLRFYRADGTASTTAAGTALNIMGGIAMDGSVTLAAAGGAAGYVSVIGGAGITESVAGSKLTIGDTTWNPTNPGIIRLDAAATHTGGTDIRQGTFRYGALTAVPAPGDMPRVYSGTLDFNGFNFTTPASGLTIGGGAAASTATIAMGAGVLTLAGDVTYDATNNPNTSTISGNLNLNSAARVFNVANSTAVNSDLTVSAAISGGGIVKSGAGSMTIGNAAHTFTGGVTINEGTLIWSNTTSNATAPVDGGFTVNSGGTLQFTATTGTNSPETDLAFTNTLGLSTNNFSVDGGTLLFTNGTDRSIVNRTFAIGALGATFNVAGTYNNFVESGVTQIRLLNTAGYLSGSGAITKLGGGRLTLRNANPNFSGAWTIENGTVETAGGGLGDASAGNTVQINGGNLAISSTTAQNITLNGGALSGNGGTRVVSGTLAVTANSHLFLNNFWTDAGATAGLTFSNVVSGSGNLGIAVNRPGYDVNNATVLLQNAANDYSGIITVGKNLRLENNSSTGSGKTLGTASVILASGNLNLRDNGDGSGGALPYGTNVSVIAPAGVFNNGDLSALTNTIDVNRSNGTNTGNTFQLGALELGDIALNVTGGNGYNLEFTGGTTLTGNATFNPTTANLLLSGPVGGAGFGFTKTGAGTLTLSSANTFTGAIAANEGTLRFNQATTGGGGAGSILLASGATVAAGFAIDQTFVNKLDAASAGVVAMAADSASNLDVSSLPLARIGAIGSVSYAGSLAAGVAGYKLGGGAAGHVLTLTGTDALTGNRALDVSSGGSGSGIVALAGENDFTGDITISGGEFLSPANNASLGNAANAITVDGGGIQFAAGAPFQLFASRAVTFGPGGFVLDTNGNDLLSTAAITGGGAGGFTKAGAGTLELGATSTYTGATTITGGVLAFSDPAQLGATPSISLTTGGTLAYTGTEQVILGKPLSLAGGSIGVTHAAGDLALEQALTGTGGFRKVGAGVLTLSVPSTFTGGVFVDEGVLAVAGQGGADPTFLGTGGKAVTIANGATFRVASGTFNPSASTKTVVIGAGGAILDTPAGATLQLDDANQFSGTGNVTKTGAGTLFLANNYSAFGGSINVTAGLLDLRNPTGAGANGNITLQPGAAFTLRANGTATPGLIDFTGNTVTTIGNATINVTRTSANTGNTINIGTLVAGSGTVTFGNADSYKLAVANGTTLTGNPAFNVAGTTNSLTLSGPVSGAGFGFTKSGNNPLNLGAGAADTVANTFSGPVSVLGGVLLLDKQADASANGGFNIVGDGNLVTADVTLGGTGTLRLNANEQIKDDVLVALNGGVFDLNGKTETVHDISLNGGAIVLGTGGALTVLNPASDFNLDLVIYDGEALGATAISRNAHYVGNTTGASIAGLTLADAAVNKIGVANGAAADDLVIAGEISGTGRNLEKIGAGTLVLSDGNTFGGAGNTITVNGGTLAYTAETALGDAANGIVTRNGGLLQLRGITAPARLPQIGTGGGGFDIPAAQTTTIASVLENVAGESGGLIKSGAGTLTLTGANTFDGGVTVTAGSVKLHGGTGSASPLGTGPLTIAGGTAELRNDASNVYGNDVNVTGAGILVFSRVGGAATNQTLTIGDLGQGGTGALTLVSSVGYTLKVDNVNLPGGLLYGNAAGFIDVTNSSLVVENGGSVLLGNGSGATVRIGSKNVNNTTSSGTAPNVTFDASMASSFVASAGVFEVGVEPATNTGQTRGLLKLPANASITATTHVVVGDSNNQGAHGTVEAGSGLTTITAPSLRIGDRKSHGMLSVAAGGTLVIGNGGGRTQLIVGRNNAQTGVSGSGTFDLSGAGAPRTLIANLQSVIVGEKTTGSSSAAGKTFGIWNLGESEDTAVSILNASGTALLAGHHNPANVAGTPDIPISGTITLNAGSLSVTTTDNVLPAVRLGWSEGTFNGTHGGEAKGVLNVRGGALSIANHGTGAAIDMTPANANATTANRRATAELNISGGSVDVAGNITVGSATGAGIWSSTISLTGGTLDMNGGSIGAVTDFIFTGGTFREVDNFARPLTQNGADSVFHVTGNDTTIGGAYTLTSGTAIIDPSRVLTATSLTAMSGLIDVKGSISGALTVQGGTVTGTGNLAEATFTGGILAPGNSPGVMNTGNLSMGVASTLSLEIGGTVAGASYDQVNVTGTVDLASTLSLSLINSFAPAPNTTFFLLLNDGSDAINGTFAGLSEGAPLTIEGYEFNITYAANGDGGDIGNDIAITSVPEPGAALALLSGLAVLAASRRNRRR